MEGCRDGGKNSNRVVNASKEEEYLILFNFMCHVVVMSHRHCLYNFKIPITICSKVFCNNLHHQ